MRIILSALALLSATSAGAATPPSAAATHDIQCFILFSAGAEGARDQEKTAALMGITYFYAKLRTHSPNLDIAQAALEQARILEGSDAEKIGGDCDTEFQNVGKELITVGQSMEKAEQARSGS